MEQEINAIMNALAVPYETALQLWREFNPSKPVAELVFVLAED